MKWLPILFYLGSYAVGPCKTYTVWLVHFARWFPCSPSHQRWGHMGWGTGAQGKWLLYLSQCCLERKENKTKQISLQNWWWFQWNMGGFLLLKTVVPLKYFCIFVWRMLRGGLLHFWPTGLQNQEITVARLLVKEKERKWLILMKSLKLEAGAAEVGNWNSSWSIL